MTAAAPEPAPIYLQLRSRILSLNPTDLGIYPSQEAPHLWGVIVETGYEVGSATLVSLADGTTSLYFSTGGGMLGRGDYAPVADASRALVAEAELHLPTSAESPEFPLPEIGQVRFTFLAYDGARSAQAAEKELTAGNHPLAPLFARAQDTLTHLHQSAQKKPKAA